MAQGQLFNNESVGNLILRAAQGIVQQSQNAQRLQQQQQQLDLQVLQQSKVLDLRGKELELRETQVANQERRAEELQPLQVDLLKAKVSAAQAPAPAKGGLTSNQRSTINQDILARAEASEVNQVIEGFNSAQNASIPLLGSVAEVDKEMRRLELVKRSFQLNPTAFITELAAQSGIIGDPSDQQKSLLETQIRRDVQTLEAMRQLDTDPGFQTFRERLRNEGPLRTTRLQIRDNFFTNVADQINVDAPGAVSPTFDFRNVSTIQLKDAWDLFDQGNVDILASLILKASGNSFNNTMRDQIRIELLRRFPTPTPEQLSNSLKLFKKILDATNAR